MLAPVSFQGAGVQAYFPDAILERLNPGYGSLDVERALLKVQPLDGKNNVQVARALASEASMTLTEAGVLTPDRFVQSALPPSLERRVRTIAPITAAVELRWQLGKAHPQIFCLDPRIDDRQEGFIPHTYVARHPTEGVNAICPYPPHYRLLDPNSFEGQYRIVHATACWVANYLIWKATKRWLGPQASHSEIFIRSQFGDSECWCRSGRPMAQCCGQRPSSFIRQARLIQTRAGGAV